MQYSMMKQKTQLQWFKDGDNKFSGFSNVGSNHKDNGERNHFLGVEFISQTWDQIIKTMGKETISLA